MQFLDSCISIGGTSEAEGMLSYEALLGVASPAEPEVSVAEDEPAGIIYTSGTTGLPKGALTSRKTTVLRLCHIAIEMGIDPDDRNLCALPLFHIGGNMIAL